MNAKYYRFLFQNVEAGVCHTGSIVDTYQKEKYHFIYISGLSNMKSQSLHLDERFTYVPEYQMMVLADMQPLSIRRAVQVLELSKVQKAFLPQYAKEDLEKLHEEKEAEGIYSEAELKFIKNPYEYLKEAGVQEVCVVMVDQSFVSNGWQYEIASYGEGMNASLVMYHGSATLSKKSEDCVMAVKYFSKQEPCRVCVDTEGASCGMKCALYNDFDICKKHNGPESKEYIDGHLLLGIVDVQKEFLRIQKRFSKVWHKIRFVAVSNGGNVANWDARLLEAGPSCYKQYFVGPKAECKNAETIKAISDASPYKHYISTSKDMGLCCSGFYKHRESVEKN